MLITLNGESREVADGTSILTLLAEHSLTPERVAVELNRRLVRAERYGEALKEGDQVEIVTFVGGG